MEWLLDNVKYVLLAANVCIFVWAMMMVRTSAETQDESGRSEVLLVTAHPDDEAMFFTPTLASLRHRKVHLLCLSNGGSSEREKEFALSCGRLGAASWSVGQFEDGFDKHWSAADVAAAVAKQVKRIGADRLKSVITFDEGGVSGHPNHVAAWRGCVEWRNTDPRAKESNLLVLHSVGLVRKYLGIAEALATVLVAPQQLFFLLWSPAEAWRRMSSSYGSQFVWYRRLFVVFSRYSLLNTYTTLH